MGAVREGFEEAEEGDLAGTEAWVRGVGSADLRDVDGAAVEGGEEETRGEGGVRGEFYGLGLWVHVCCVRDGLRECF